MKFNKKEYFSIRKTKLGVGSVLLGSALLLGGSLAQAEEKTFNDIEVNVDVVRENATSENLDLTNERPENVYLLIEKDKKDSYYGYKKISPSVDELNRGYDYIIETYKNDNSAKILTKEELTKEGGFKAGDLIITGRPSEFLNKENINAKIDDFDELGYKLPYIYYPEKPITWNTNNDDKINISDFTEYNPEVQPENATVVKTKISKKLPYHLGLVDLVYTYNNYNSSVTVGNKNLTAENALFGDEEPLKKVVFNDKFTDTKGNILNVSYYFDVETPGKDVSNLLYTGKSETIMRNNTSFTYNAGIASKTTDGRIATRLVNVITDINTTELENEDEKTAYSHRGWGHLLSASGVKYGSNTLASSGDGYYYSGKNSFPINSEAMHANLMLFGLDKKGEHTVDDAGKFDRYGQIIALWKDGKEPRPLKINESEIKEYKLIDIVTGKELTDWETVTFVGDTRQYDKDDDFRELDAIEAYKFKNNERAYEIGYTDGSVNLDVDGEAYRFYEDRKRQNFVTNADNLDNYDGYSWDLVPSYGELRLGESAEYTNYNGPTASGASFLILTSDKISSTLNVYRIAKEEEKGSVVVAYENEVGEVVKNEENLVNNQPVGTPYNSTPDDTITGNDGKTYYKVKLKDDSQPATGDVTKETKKVTWVYRLPEVTEVKGNVVVKYVDTEGRELLSDYATDEAVVTTIVNRFTADGGKQLVSSTLSNETYNVEEQKHPKITDQNIVYNFKEIQDSKPLTGTLAEGETVITLVYEKTPTETREEMGHVKVVYADENGREIDTAVVKPDEAVNRIVEQPMVDGTKTLLSTTPTNAAYDVNADKKERIEFDGKVYKFKQVKDTQPTGTLAVGETVVTYVYEVVKGDVEVKYTDTEGVEIKDKITPYDDVPIKSNYDVSNKKEDTIEFGGKVYRYKETTGNTNGEVTENTTTVTYVYDVVKGDVEVKYTDTEGVEIKDKVTPYDDVPIKSNYDVSNKKEDTIEFGGKVYRYKETTGNTNGEVTENTTTVTYVYDVVKGDVEVKYTDTEGVEIKDKITPYDDVPIKSNYDVSNKKEDTIEFGGKVYRYKETKGNPTGEVTEDTTTITYVYEVVNEVVKGDVEVKYTDTEGVEIKNKVKVYDGAPIKSAYDVSNKKEDRIEIGGKVYRYKETKGNPTGEVTEDTTTITYVYEVVKGDVEVKYTDEKGVEIKNKVKVYDGVPIKSAYDVSNKKEDRIEFGGKVYKYKETKGNPTGEVTEDTTVIIYIYEELKPNEPLPDLDIKKDPNEKSIVENNELEEIKIDENLNKDKEKDVKKLPNTGTTTTNYSALGTFAVIGLLALRRKITK